MPVCDAVATGIRTRQEMGSARQISQLFQLFEDGHNDQTAARELDVPLGPVFMVANGIVADASEAPGAAMSRPEASPQPLINPPRFEPPRKQEVVDWARQRARRERSGGS